MGRKLGLALLPLVLALPVAAAGKPGVISGYVRNAQGVPQMGALVELFTSPLTRGTIVYTDAHGYYSAPSLVAGTYQVKVSAPSFLPSLRENVLLRAGASLVVNVTLNTLFEAIQLLPQHRPLTDDDDWKWALRSAANRPILRLNDEGPLVVVSKSDRSDDRALKASVAFVAGDSDTYNSTGEMSTRFTVERSLFSTGTVSLNGNVGYGSGPSGVLKADYSQTLPNGSHPEVALTVRRFASADSLTHNAALQALALTMSDSMSLAELVDLHFGAELQTVQFMGRVSAYRPFGSVDVHLSPNTLLEYQYATSEPNMRTTKGFDSSPADLSEAAPRFSFNNGEAAIERARHQEVSLSRRMGKTSIQLAAYTEEIANTALTGAGDEDDLPGNVLPDIYSSTFSYNGGQLNTNGVRFVAQRKLPDNLTATIDYSYGGVLDLVGSNLDWSALRSSIHTERRHAVGFKISGAAPGTRTRWIASYKWNSGNSLSPVDAFNTSPGQMDPYFNLFIRQPMPAPGFMQGKMELLVDLHNLLAQGYIPVVGGDGRTVYLVQSARAVRGGLAFNF